ncbi:hypothetical protein A2U01_0087136, partial [Trifolium medium]|nr:hypothetical protein [Trifolium medium]
MQPRWNGGAGNVSIGFNYDDLIIIGVTRVRIKGRCASRVSEPGGVRRR